MATNQNTNVFKEEANYSLVLSLPTLVYSYPYSPLFPNKQKKCICIYSPLPQFFTQMGLNQPLKLHLAFLLN